MRILIAEDDDVTALRLEQGLRELGHDVVRVSDGSDAIRVGEGGDLDMAILDRMLPGANGTAIVRHWREAGLRFPVLMLTALGGIGDRVTGLDAGADDYLVKPFAFVELAARVAALARRPAMGGEQTRFDVGDVTLDLLKREVRRAGREVRLQPREFALLEQLMRHGGKVVTRAMFLESIWGFHFDPQTNIVESHLSRMRSKLNEGFETDPIQTLRGIGYRITADG